MSFNNLRKALDELDAVAARDTLVDKARQLQKQNQQLCQENNQLQAENLGLEEENSKLRAKANHKEAEIQRRAKIIADEQVRRRYIEEKPLVIASAVDEEIKGYPSNCASSTKRIMRARSRSHEASGGWTPILFTISNAIKASLKPAPIALPVVKVKIKSEESPTNLRKILPRDREPPACAV